MTANNEDEVMSDNGTFETNEAIGFGWEVGKSADGKAVFFDPLEWFLARVLSAPKAAVSDSAAERFAYLKRLPARRVQALEQLPHPIGREYVPTESIDLARAVIRARPGSTGIYELIIAAANEADVAHSISFEPITATPSYRPYPGE